MTDREDPLDPIIEILREPAGLMPDLTDRVMSEVDRLPPPGVAATSRVHWWRSHWTIQLSPVRSLGVAAGLAVLVLAVHFASRQGGPTAPMGDDRATAGRLTQFVLIAPEASAVTVVGDFNDWSVSATPLERAEGDGVWHVTLPLGPGRYRYAFVVNGTTWRHDPEAPATDDEFGGSNSVVTVGGT